MSLLFNLACLFILSASASAQTPTAAANTACKTVDGTEYCVSDGSKKIALGPFQLIPPKNWTYYVGHFEDGRSNLEMSPDSAEKFSNSKHIVTLIYLKSKTHRMANTAGIENLQKTKGARLKPVTIEKFSGISAEYESDGLKWETAVVSNERSALRISVGAPPDKFNEIQAAKNRLFKP